MKAREVANKSPFLTTVAMVALAVAAVAFIIWRLLPGTAQTPRPGQVYFTDDDGKTFFPDDAWKIAPFESANHREAVRAHVYRCGAAGKPFVGWMEKYTAEARQELVKFAADPRNQGKFSPLYSADAARLMKKPGDDNWSRWSFERLERYSRYKCQSTGELAEEISPPSS